MGTILHQFGAFFAQASARAKRNRRRQEIPSCHQREFPLVEKRDKWGSLTCGGAQVGQPPW